MRALLLAGLFALLAGGAAAAPWLTYDRSGGITGWTLKVAVDDEGRVSVAGTRLSNDEAKRRRLEAGELQELKRLVEKALAVPARKPLEELRWLADGMQRVVTLEDADGGRLIVLSDGLALSESDRALIAGLEALGRREPLVAASTKPAPAQPALPRIDLVEVDASEAPAGSPTALLLELPVGRVHEPEERAGAIELLLLTVLGAKSEVLLDGGPEVNDPDTGRWSLSVTATRTRLLVVNDGLPPAALRGATAQLRRLVARSTATIDQTDWAELDHHRRRLADAVHDRASKPSAARQPAVRAAAWGPRAGASPEPFGISALTKDDLRALAARLDDQQPRLLAAGPLGRRALSLCARGFERSARGPLAGAAPEPSASGLGAPRNETLAAAGTTEISAGLPGALALELARRRFASTWLERVEAGDDRLALPGDTWLLVAPDRPDGAERTEKLARALERLSRGLSESAVGNMMRRRSLRDRAAVDPARLVREAADLLELGATHPGSAALFVAPARDEVEAVDAERVRAAAAELARHLRPVPAAPTGASDRSRLQVLASEALLGSVIPGRVVVEGRSPAGATTSWVEIERDLRLSVGGVQVDAGRLPAGSTAASRREQGLALAALTEPAVLIAGSLERLFPVRELPGESIRLVSRRSKRFDCGVLEVLVPARGSYRLLVDRRSGDVRAVDRLDPFGRTIRVEMSDIREFDGTHRAAARRVRLDAEGRREPLLEEASVRLEPR